MEYLLMSVAIIFSALNSILLHKFRNRTFQTPGDAFFFNGGISVVWIIILGIWFVLSPNSKISLESILYGVVYGVILALFLYFKSESMASGPVSLSTLIGSCAFFIATCFGVLYAKESVNIFQIIGMGLILVSLVMCVNPKKSVEKLTPKWFINCFVFFVAGGLVGIIYKLFGKSDVSDQVNTMILTAAIVSAVLFFLLGYFVNYISKENPPTVHKDALIYILLSGIAGCIYIRLNIPLANLIPSAVFFPISNGSMVVLTTLAGNIIFKEKLNSVQKAGILVGIIAIIINGSGSILWNFFTS